MALVLFSLTSSYDRQLLNVKTENCTRYNDVSFHAVSLRTEFHKNRSISAFTVEASNQLNIFCGYIFAKINYQN
jgi:hypothetical protein